MPIATKDLHTCAWSTCPVRNTHKLSSPQPSPRRPPPSPPVPSSWLHPGDTPNSPVPLAAVTSHNPPTRSPTLARTPAPSRPPIPLVRSLPRPFPSLRSSLPAPAPRPAVRRAAVRRCRRRTRRPGCLTLSLAVAARRPAGSRHLSRCTRRVHECSLSG
ncbi:hypothetical protein HDK90DRAFT_271029 [Phyllosticta capitalensis]|uniref:Uncharacterized protein n=1 Tax=Phyllosticta capitalensis TaxID=121624 RepID=A0ABR1YM35_9PEZI